MPILWKTRKLNVLNATVLSPAKGMLVNWGILMTNNAWQITVHIHQHSAVMLGGGTWVWTVHQIIHSNHYIFNGIWTDFCITAQVQALTNSIKSRIFCCYRQVNMQKGQHEILPDCLQLRRLWKLDNGVPFVKHHSNEQVPLPYIKLPWTNGQNFADDIFRLILLRG